MNAIISAFHSISTRFYDGIRRKEYSGDIVKILPAGVLEIILEKLSVHELAVFQTVSKDWKEKVDEFYKEKCITLMKPNGTSWQHHAYLLAKQITHIQNKRFLDHDLRIFVDKPNAYYGLLRSGEYICAYQHSISNLKVIIYRSEGDHKAIFDKDFELIKQGDITIRGFNYPDLFVLEKKRPGRVVGLDVKYEMDSGNVYGHDDGTWNCTFIQYHHGYLIRGGNENGVNSIRIFHSGFNAEWDDPAYYSDLCLIAHEKKLFYAGHQGVLIIRKLVSPFERTVLSPAVEELSQENLQLFYSHNAKEEIPKGLELKFELLRDHISSIVVDGTCVATCTKSAIRIWNISSGKMIQKIALEGEFRLIHLEGHLIIAQKSPDYLCVWNAFTGKLVAEIWMPDTDCTRLATTFYDGKLYYLKKDGDVYRLAYTPLGLSKPLKNRFPAFTEGRFLTNNP